jgi:hypothetical protein
MAVDVSPKQLEMLLDMVPKLSRVALLVKPSNSANVKGVDAVQAAGQKRGVKILRADARTSQEIDDAFAWIRQQNAGALMMWTEPFFLQQKNPDCTISREASVASHELRSDLFRGGCFDELRDEYC